MASFILRKVEDAIWQKFRARAQSEGRSLRWVILTLIEFYIDHGLPRKR